MRITSSPCSTAAIRWLLCSFVFGSVAMAQDGTDSTKFSPNLIRILKEHKARMDKLQQSYDKAVLENKKATIKLLKTEQDVMLKQNKLEEAIAVRNLLKEMSADVDAASQGETSTSSSDATSSILDQVSSGSTIGDNLLSRDNKQWEAVSGTLVKSGQKWIASGHEHSRAYTKVKKGPFVLETEFVGLGHDKIIWIGDTSVVMRPNTQYNDIGIGNGDDFGGLGGGFKRIPGLYDLSEPNAELGRQIAKQKVQVTVTTKKLTVTVNGKEAISVDGDFTADRVGFGVWHANQTMEMLKMNYALKR